ncbi:hypothetical protein [Candidatus Fonsibacter ubiquis]|uniref:hypothetical protein n=1 Tax=Candidatus Fonsibacter ubiquis TaxID=1925548 RepID=UPI000C06B048|nr:hypothetical protein [Candidatus Fonsibacter ubiquis]
MAQISKKKESNIFFLYLSFLFICASIFLFNKHTVGNDSTMSEWLINYQGGFTRRGLLGEIAFKLALLFESKIRFVVFLFQIFFYLIFLILTFNFIKKIQLNFLLRLALYSPIFLLFPLAEIESLVRKETLIFIIFIVFLYLSSNKYSEKYCNSYIFFIFPVSFLIWEPVIFFFPFIIFILYIKNFKKNIIRVVCKTLIICIPSFVTFLLVILNPLSDSGHDKMCLELMSVFQERCYMSLALLKSKSTILQQFTANNYKIEYFIRYIIIIIVGFLPLFILCANSKFNKKKIIFPFRFKFFFIILILLLSPVPILFAAMYDWGRVVNIAYTFSIFTYFFLIKNKYFKFYEGFLYSKLKKFFITKKYYYILFFLYFSCWNIKTVISDRVGSFPIYRIITKSFKLIINN